MPIFMSIVGFLFILIAIASNIFIYIVGIIGTLLFAIGNKWLARQISAEMIYRRCPFCNCRIFFSFKHFKCNECGKILNIKLSEGIYINKPFSIED